LAKNTLDTLFKIVGVTRVLIPDNAEELTQGLFHKKARRAGAAVHPIEAYTEEADAYHSWMAVIRQVK
jgi:hypothetical protein